MLIRLLPNQVADNWDVISETIKRCLPISIKFDDTVNENLLKSVYEDRLVCWTYVREKEVVCVITTTINTDFCTGSRSLLIFSMYSILPINQSEWEGMFNFMKSHAQNIGCNSIVAYTENQALASMVKTKLNATIWNFISLEV